MKVLDTQGKPSDIYVVRMLAIEFFNSNAVKN
jgi:hypothetical protein